MAALRLILIGGGLLVAGAGAEVGVLAAPRPPDAGGAAPPQSRVAVVRPAAPLRAWLTRAEPRLAAAHQDFQFSGGAVEVKTTAAKQPQSVRITSERQLDDTGVGALFLHVVVVDEREVSSSRGDEALIPRTMIPVAVDVSPLHLNSPYSQSLLTSAATKSGLSLPALIADTRTELSADPVALAAFNGRLLDRGWLDAHQRQLRVPVPARADARHHVAALGLGEHIGHGIRLTTDEHRRTRIPTERDLQVASTWHVPDGANAFMTFLRADVEAA